MADGQIGITPVARHLRFNQQARETTFQLEFAISWQRRLGRHYLHLLFAQYFLDKSEFTVALDEALLTSIAANYLLLRYAAIRKHKLQ